MDNKPEFIGPEVKQILALNLHFFLWDCLLHLA